MVTHVSSRSDNDEKPSAGHGHSASQCAGQKLGGHLVVADVPQGQGGIPCHVPRRVDAPASDDVGHRGHMLVDAGRQRQRPFATRSLTPRVTSRYIRLKQATPIRRFTVRASRPAAHTWQNLDLPCKREGLHHPPLNGRIGDERSRYAHLR